MGAAWRNTSDASGETSSTSPPSSEHKARSVAAIYRARWAVEIQFRAWKQALNLGKALNRKSGEHHLQALVLAGIIAHQLGMKIAQRIGSVVGRARLSYEKLYDLLAVRLIKAAPSPRWPPTIPIRGTSRGTSEPENPP